MTSLPTRPLGTSGLQITTVGFGAWAAGGGGWAYGWGPQDDAASIAAMRHALERGVKISLGADAHARAMANQQPVAAEAADGIADVVAEHRRRPCRQAHEPDAELALRGEECRGDEEGLPRQRQSK